MQLINGIYDKEIQEKVLAAGAALPEGGEMTLSEAVKMIQSCEMGKYTHAELSKSTSINRVSEHRKNKDQGRRDGKPATGGGQKSGCGFCGRSNGHARDDCPAKDKKCNNCEKLGHFAAKCRKPKKAKVAEVAAESAPTAAVSTLRAEITELDDDDGDFFGEVTGQINRISVSGAPEASSDEVEFRGASSKAAAVACLLYTSPSPRDQRGSRMPSSA